MTFKNLEKINNLIDYLESHNKNYTKKQYYYILDLQEIIFAEYKKRKNKKELTDNES